MYLRFWGVRGSIPTPGTNTSLYGGNTSCTELRTDEGSTIILDCGTGARELGLLLMTRPQVRAHILISHTHWDHIQGFPFFAPAFRPDAEVTIYGPAGFLQNLEQAMSGQMQYAYFPISLEDLRSRIRFVTVEEGTFNIEHFQVTTQYLNHTTPTMGYRVSSGGATVVYATDHEPFSSPTGALIHPGDLRHMEFLQNADLVIHDAQYTPDEYAGKPGWGHSTLEYAADVAMNGGAKRLALFHHDPTHTDSMIQRLEAGIRANVAANRSDMEVFAAQEGMALYIQERTPQTLGTATDTALRRQPLAGTRVLIATNQGALGTQIANVLRQDGLQPIVVSDGERVVEATRQLRPGIVILDARLFGSRVFAVSRALNEDSGATPLPVILLAAELNEAELRRAQASGVTDYLSEPLSAPMLHARIRSWLNRYFQPTLPKVGSVSISSRSVAFGEVPPMAWANPTLDAPIPPLRDPHAKEPPARPRSKAALLADVPLFGTLPQREIVKIAAKAKLHDFNQGEAIIEQGSWGDQLFIIASGRVRVVGHDQTVRAGEILLAELGPGEVFGELSLLDEVPHSASVRALTKTRCLAIPAQTFRTTLQEHPVFSLRLLRVLSRRLQLADSLLLREGPDAVTGLMTLRTFREQYRREATLALRRNYPMAIAMVTLSNLETINDEHGYTIGDEALRAVADALRASVRITDYLARSRGNQFVALLTDTAQDGPTLVSGRLHLELEKIAASRDLPPLSCDIKYLVPDKVLTSLEDVLNHFQEQQQTAPSAT